jgi:anti-sigma B factor antagonist
MAGPARGSESLASKRAVEWRPVVTEPPNKALEISVAEATDGVRRVSLTGDLDMATASDLRSALAEQPVAAGIVLDVSGLEFIDSSGLNTIVVGARNLTDRGGTMIVAGAPDHIATVFEIVELERSVAVDASVDAAVQRAARPAGGATADRQPI